MKAFGGIAGNGQPVRHADVRRCLRNRANLTTAAGLPFQGYVYSANKKPLVSFRGQRGDAQVLERVFQPHGVRGAALTGDGKFG